jgi:hypothetical protein
LNLKIKEIKDKKDFNNFITLPWEIYKDDKDWVPPIISEVENILTGKNPFWDHSEKKLFLLYDGDKLVGRIAGIIDDNYINFQEERAGFFGFFECFNNFEYAKILIDTVKDWLLTKDIKIMYGPMNPSTNDEMGFFLEGEAGSPMLMMPYNPKYYIELMEQLGLEKAKDLYAYLLDFDSVNIEKVKFLQTKLANKFAEKNVKVRCINMKNLKEEIKFALDVYNSAWEKNWGFVPWTEAEFYNIASMLKTLADPNLILFLEVENKPAGMIIIVPDFNQVMKKLNGKLDVIGILKFLWYKRKMDQARLMILGVKKEFRKQGFESLLYWTGYENLKKTGFKKVEFSWILEDNVLTCRAAEMFGGKLYRKYRVYKKDIGA